MFPKITSCQVHTIDYRKGEITLERKNIRFAYGLVLPFRLLIGEFYRLSFTFKERKFEVVLINRPINSLSEWEDIQFKERHDVFTKAIILVEDPIIKDSEIEEFGKLKDQRSAQLHNSSQAMEAFNHFLIGYSIATERMTGFRPIRSIKTDVFFRF